jgi:hypothetical protein
VEASDVYIAAPVMELDLIEKADNNFGVHCTLLILWTPKKLPRFSARWHLSMRQVHDSSLAA